MGTNKNQKGFTVVEGLLIVLILVVVGFGGYYVWHTQHNKDQSSNSSASTSSTTAKTTTADPNADYFVIKEWGVRAKYSGSLMLEYNIEPPATDSALFSSKQLDASGNLCGQGEDYGGIITRYKSADHYLVGDDGVDSGKTAAQYAASLNKEDYGHVGDYYYFYKSAQAACGDSQTSQNIQGETHDAILGLLPNLVAVPAQ